jgi:hypothetical protein
MIRSIEIQHRDDQSQRRLNLYTSNGVAIAMLAIQEMEDASE